MKPLNNEQAFTLVELIIAMAILAALSLSTSRSLRSSAQLKTSLQAKIDQQARFRSVMNIIKKDISMAFHHRDVSLEILRDIKAREKQIIQQASNNSTPGGGGGTPPGGGEGTPPAEGTVSLLDLTKYERELIDPTQFMGDNDALHFTNANNIKISPDDLASSHQEVGYYVKNCRNRIDTSKSYNCLWRRTNPVIDADVSQGGEEFVLLENISVFKLRYLGEGMEEWQDRWYSNPRGDARTQNRFPGAVEVSIAYKDENDKVSEAVFIAGVAFTNNPPLQNPRGGLPRGGLSR